MSGQNYIENLLLSYIIMDSGPKCDPLDLTHLYGTLQTKDISLSPIYLIDAQAHPTLGLIWAVFQAHWLDLGLILFQAIVK